MTVLDIPHHFTNTPAILAGCLVVAAVLSSNYWTARAMWRRA